MRQYFCLCLTFVLMALSFAVKAEEGSAISLLPGNVNIVVPEGECSPVKLAVTALQRDFSKVMGFTPAQSTVPATSSVSLVVVNDATPAAAAFGLKPLEGFESHEVSLSADGKLVYLHGADMRGTIYAIYTFSEEILGVPPLWYWCDWQPVQKAEIQIPASYSYHRSSPTVRYRAWFPNDQDLFVPWRAKSTQNNELWLETMLRLKLNTVEKEATVTNSGTLNSEAMLYKKYGMVLTSHHMVALNNSFSNWDSYWKDVRKMTPPALSVKDLTSLKEFWQFSIDAVMKSGVENLWQVAFRGKGDQPFWEIFSDAPASDAERGRIISEMVKIQYDMICKSTGEANPFVRMTFYDEISSLLAKGYIQPPVATNMLWTFVAGRRDHYPFDDLVQWENKDGVKLGYYMNLQFYSTGAHLAPAEGPWKMEDNYRYVQSKGPLTFSVVNAGNVREFLMEMSANAQMMWDSEHYDTDKFLRSYCQQYFGAEHAQEIADIYHDFYYAYWCQKKSDFPGGFDRQYIFQDLRHERAIKQINDKWNSYTANPLVDIGYESIPGRSFRIEGSNQVDSIIAGTSREMKAFQAVADRCDAMTGNIPEAQRTFFYDNMAAYAHYMAHVSASLYFFARAYKNKTERLECLTQSLAEMQAAKKALTDSQHGVFSSWYATDDKFAMDAKIDIIRKRLEEAPPFSVEAGKAYTIANRNDENLFVLDNGGDVVGLGRKGDNACWEFISTGKLNCFYIRNLATGRYVQACPGTSEVNVRMGTAPVEYVLVDCSDDEDARCFGITSTNLSVTDFTAGCIGWNWKGDNTVQSYPAVAGTNHRSFWKLSETTFVKPQPEGEKELTELISNNDFEQTTGMIADGTNFRGIPTGWHGWGMKGNAEYNQEPGVNNTTLLPKASYGANGGCAGSLHGAKSYWVNCAPMPDDFKLYQTVSLPKGTYRLSCLLSPMNTGDENLTNLRLFAGENACYFGSADKYDKNLGPEANRVFMGNTVTLDGSDPVMKEMMLEFTLQEDADIEIGIRTSNMKKDGSRATSNQGRFRVDYFRLYAITEVHVHDYTHNGICSCDGAERFEVPAKEGNYYLLDNAGKVEWFSQQVAANGGSTVYYAKLTDDIDFEREVNLHLPIGKTKGNKFKGVFDGQGHCIKNMVIYRPQDEAQGFFGYLQGNSACTIRNLIIDQSCSVIAQTKAAGLAGSCQNTGATITIENCVNEANVTVSGQDAAGIIGGQNDTNPCFVIRNCVNTGIITSTNASPYAGALCCYLGNAGNAVENFINLGTINGHRGGNMGRISGTIKNIVDLSDTNMDGTVDGQNRGLESGLSSEAVTNGALAYYMNKVAGTTVFCQLIGTDAYPSPLNEAEVYSNWTTFYDETTGYVLNGGEAKAYTGAIDGEWLILTEISGDIPAGTPVVVSGTYYNRIAKAGVPAINQANDLKGSAEAVEVNGTQYVLAQPEGEEVGFYQAEAGTTIAAGKAYLERESKVKVFYFGEDNPNGISPLSQPLPRGGEEIYNLVGQKRNKIQKGINIVGDKKVLF